MATPSSSATSPSPPMAYLHHMPVTQQSVQDNIPDTLEQDQRRKAVDKFLARAEIAMVTRRLRAQLAYASYKATHNIPHASFREVEAQSQSQTASFNRTIAAKRKAVGSNNHYATIGSTSTGAGSLRRGGSSSMAPPASISSPRLYPTSAMSTPGPSGSNDVASSHRNTSQAPNLYASILAPPATKLARTIHNPNDPPVPAPERPTQTPKSSRSSKTSPRNDPSRPSKGKQSAKNAKATAPADRRRKKPTSSEKRKTKRRHDDMDVDGEMDMKAAATLTSLLLHNRPSIAGSAGSPRSSIDGSEVGSAYSYPQFSQSRNASQKAPPISAAPSSSTLVAESSFRCATPPPSGTPKQHTSTTPRVSAPTDNEAANLMLFLATSPSPVRPTTTNKESRDAATYRLLDGHPGPLRSKGRVLFPSATDRGVESTDASSGSPPRTTPLTRGADNSFSSSISSIALDGSFRTELLSSQPSVTVVGSPALTPSGSMSQLLPAAPLPLPTAPSSPAAGRKDDGSLNPSSLPPHLAGVHGGGTAGGNPTMEFNIHEFINASPSPFAPAQAVARTNLGLRADVGRKLFEEEQLRHFQAAQNASRHDERTLGAGIDLVHT